jgi:DNA polymerase III subunit delta
MKITGRSVDSFLRSVDAKVIAILLYGPDLGLVRERAERLTVAIAGDTADPFRVSEVRPQQLRDEPGLLADEAAALTFGGGRRVVRLRDASDTATSAVENLLALPAAAGVAIVEAGDLAPRSSLRRLFEGADNAAALPCYRDEPEDVGRLVVGELRQQGLTIADAALAYLVASLGSDRGVSRREIEKLISYMGDAKGERRIELADVVACVGDSAALSLDDLVFAVADGDAAAVERSVTRTLQEGTNPVAILRAVARHFLRLHLLAAAPDRDRAVAGLRPPVFFKHVPRLKEQVRGWSAAQLRRALDRLVDAELDCKRTGIPADTVCRRALLDVALLVRAPVAG